MVSPGLACSKACWTARSSVSEWTNGTGTVEFGGDFFRGGADEKGGARVGLERLAQRSVGAAFVLAAEDDQQRRIEGGDGFERGVYVGGFRVVVKLHAADFGDVFDAMLDAGERANAIGDGGRFGSGEPRGDRRGENIFDVVIAAEGNFVAAQNDFFVAMIADDDLRVAHVGARSDVLLAAEPVNAGRGRDALGDLGIVGVEDGGVALALIFEHAQLGAGVLGEGMMAIEMIGSEIEEQCDVRAEGFDGFELEAADFRDGEGSIVGEIDERDERRADISADCRWRCRRI